MIFKTTVKRHNIGELDIAIKDLEARGYYQATEIVPTEYDWRDYEYTESRINSFKYIGRKSVGVGFKVLMKKEVH